MRCWRRKRAEAASWPSVQRRYVPLRAPRGRKSELIEPFFGDTQIFIYPGYQYKVIDALVTNFHLPESTLIMLVSAFAGISIRCTYLQVCGRTKISLFSYGDAMFITYNPRPE